MKKSYKSGPRNNGIPQGFTEHVEQSQSDKQTEFETETEAETEAENSSDVKQANVTSVNDKRVKAVSTRKPVSRSTARKN